MAESVGNSGTSPRSRPRARGLTRMVLAALVAFLALFVLLATRLAAGQDPALRSRAASSPAPPRRVLIRRVIERRVIVHLPPTEAVPPAQTSQQASSVGAFAPLVTRTS